MATLYTHTFINLLCKYYDTFWALGSVRSSLRLNQSWRRFTKYAWAKMRILWKKLFGPIYVSRKEGNVLRFRSRKGYIREYQHYRSQNLSGVRGKYQLSCHFYDKYRIFYFYFLISLPVSSFIYHARCMQ